LKTGGFTAVVLDMSDVLPQARSGALPFPSNLIGSGANIERGQDNTLA